MVSVVLRARCRLGPHEPDHLGGGRRRPLCDRRDQDLVVNAQHAEYGILLARTDPGQRGHRGISFFLLDMGTPGVEVRPIRQMTGDREFCEVFLDGVPVPASARLGPENEGWRVATEVLLDERGSSAAGIVSLERRLYHLRPLAGEDPAHRDALLRLYVRGQALRMLLLRRGDGGPAASSSAKLMRTELEFDIELALANAARTGCAARRPGHGPVPLRPRHAHSRGHQRDPAEHHRRACAGPAPRAALTQGSRRSDMGVG